MSSSLSSIAERQRILDIVARIWTATLRVERVGPEDNFFKLGGDSLKAGVIMTHIQNQLHISLDPIEIFDAPVLRDFADGLASMLVSEGDVRNNTPVT